MAKKQSSRKRSSKTSSRKKKRLTGLDKMYDQRAKAHGTSLDDERDQSEFTRSQ